MKISDFRVGQTVKILSKPERWSSYFINNNPLQVSDKEYPMEAIIQKIKNCGGCTAMQLKDYGWDLSELVREKKIVLIHDPKKTPPILHIFN